MLLRLPRLSGTNRSVKFVTAVPLLIGMLVLVGSWQWQNRQQKALVRWRDKALSCESLATTILSLRDQPRLVKDRVVDSHTLAGYIERAARRVGMSQNHIRSIRPEHPRRLKDSPYVETATKVRLTEVPIADIAKLIWNLQEESPGVAIAELRIWVESPASLTWEAELDLVALAYSPLSE